MEFKTKGRKQGKNSLFPNKGKVEVLPAPDHPENKVPEEAKSFPGVVLMDNEKLYISELKLYVG